MSNVVNIKNKNIPRDAVAPPREDNVLDALESVKIALYRLRDTGERVKTKYGNTAALEMIDSFTAQAYEGTVKIGRRFNGY
jgi:hypothetical protein